MSGRTRRTGLLGLADIGQCHPISASENQRQDLEALQGSAARAKGTHEPFPVTWHGGAASAESICRHAEKRIHVKAECKHEHE